MLNPFNFKYIPILLFMMFIFHQVGSSEGLKFRKYAGEFLEIGVAPRAQALGGGFTAVVDDITAAYYNPAGLIHLNNLQASFLHTQQLIASINYDFIAFGFPQNSKRVFSISITRLGIDNIKDSRAAQVYFENDPENWRIDWEKVSTFNAADYVVTLSMAQKWFKGWAIGGSLKIIRRNLAEHTANGLGIDIGLQKRFYNKLLFGLNLKNTTTTLIVWDTGEKELVKPVLYLGSAYILEVNKLNSIFRPIIDVIIRAEDRNLSAKKNIGIFSADVAGGIEYAFRKTLFLRIGIDEISRMNAGVGIQIPHMRFDYAFANYDSEIGNSHRIGIIIDF
jgi:hypothetical protein